MKIALAQLNYHIGNFEANTEKIIRTAQNAATQHADLVIFAEMAICGYPPRDFLEFDDFITRINQAIAEIAESCFDIPIIIGAPVRNTGSKGKALYNAAIFLHEGKQQIFRKALLPDYDVFDEYRYFEPAQEFECLSFKGKKVAVTICEDLWNISENPLYFNQPMENLIRENPDYIVNIAASPFDYRQAAMREEVLKNNVRKYKIPLIYVNHVGAQTELLFDGGSMVISQKAEVHKRMDFFKEGLTIFDLETDFSKPKKVLELPTKMELIHQALVMGIRNYFEKLGFKKAILGLSGGLDSALTMALAAEALGAENVFAVLMPSQFSSDHSIKDAVDLAENLGSPYETIAIDPLYKSFKTQLEPLFSGQPDDVTEENIQARARGVLLMAISNKFGYILLNTSNKSEAAVGYGTLYGDMNGGISVLGDVYKTEAFELARHINKDREIIPENTIVKPPSAELRPNQKDSDSLPDYAILDAILYAYIEQRKGPETIIGEGFDEKIVRRVLRLVNQNEYKRHQTPPILRVSPKAFGMGRKMPIVAKYLI
ncbi:MAG: NAD+ synthase [Bacteroidales bacterium]|nr:NAD+ synthase [Bacteroidales bacterium]